MQIHVKNYHSHYDYCEGDVIVCQYCKQQKANSIHHIVYRSHFGKKRKDECNHWSNLIALCRECHEAAHNEKISKDELLKIINLELLF